MRKAFRVRRTTYRFSMRYRLHNYTLCKMGSKKVIEKSADTEKIIGEKVPQVSVAPATSSKRKIQDGVVNIQATFNNTIISISDTKGNVLAWASSGNLGFKGSKKATPYAATRVAEVVAERVKKFGVQDVSIYVKGVGSGRESAIRAIINQGMQPRMIKDVTPLPHNGPRAKKPRRV